VEPFEPVDIKSEYTSKAQLYRHGHKGLLTIHLDAHAEKQTTVKDSYQHPQFPSVCTRGKKEELFERTLYDKIRLVTCII